MHFVASASSSLPITGMRIYVDGVSAFATGDRSLDVYVGMGIGTHLVAVQAWDSSGAVFVSTQSITITGGISVSTPLNGAQVGSPVHVVASSSATRPITQTVIYLDNNLVFTGSGSALDTTIAASGGTHSLVVQSWDSGGAVYKQPLTIAVGSGVPSNATVISQIQNLTSWQACSSCAGANGTGPVAGFSLVQNQLTPALSGKSSQFNIWGSTPYSAALWWRQLGGNNAATNFKYDLDFYLTAPQYAQALEFDVNQSIGNLKFIFGTQCNIRDGGTWDVWDTANAAWRRTAVPCTTPAGGVWHHLTWEFQRNASQTIFVAVTLDGVRHPINAVYNARPVSATEINTAFQMDGDFAMHPYSVWLDNVTLSYW